MGTTTNAVVVAVLAAKVEKAAAVTAVAIITETPYEWLNCKLLPLQNKSTFSLLFAKSCSGRSRCGGVEFYIYSLSRGSSFICRAELGAAAYVHTSGLNAHMHANSCIHCWWMHSSLMQQWKQSNLTCVGYSLMSDYSICAFNPTTAASNQTRDCCLQRICHIFIMTVSMDTGAETQAFTVVISEQAMLEGKRGVHFNELSLPTVFLNNKKTFVALGVALKSPHPSFS